MLEDGKFQDEQDVNSLQPAWENPPSLMDLKANIEAAKPDRYSQLAKLAIWRDNMNGTGTARINAPKGNSTLVPKVIRKQAEWRYGALSEPFLSTDDVFNVEPVTFEDVDRAKQNQLVLNNQFNTKINKTKFVDEYVRTAVDDGTVIVAVGWESKEETKMVTKDIYGFTRDTGGIIGQHYLKLLELRMTDPVLYEKHTNPGIDQALDILQSTGDVVIPRVVGTEEVTETKETVNRPTLDILSQENVLVDPSCNGDLDIATFVAITFETNLDELRKDGKYTNIDKINVQGATILAQPDHEVGKDIGSFEHSDDSQKRFVAIEYWGYHDYDNVGTAQPFVCTWVGDVLIRLEENPYPDKKLPFVLVSYLPVRKSIYGEPDGELLADNQKVIGAITRGMIDLLGKSANGQTAIRKDMLDVTNRRKFNKGEDYEFNGTTDPRQGIYQHQFPEIPQSAYNMLTLTNNDSESLTGVKAYNSGISGQALGDVAAGVRGALDAASKRELGILRRLADGVTQIGRKFISMNSEFLSDEEIIRVTNEDFVAVRRDDLAGNYDLKLSISTAEEDNQKGQELAFMLQTVGPKVEPTITFKIMSKIARLRKIPDLAKELEEYEPPPPSPAEQKQQQLQLLLVQSEIQKNLAEAAVDKSAANLNAIKAISERADAILTVAKTGTEQAKARQMGSTADKQDLDYIEQSEGVTQERELEKQGAQAKAQAATKIIEHELKKQEGSTSAAN